MAGIGGARRAALALAIMCALAGSWPATAGAQAPGVTLYDGGYFPLGRGGPMPGPREAVYNGGFEDGGTNLAVWTVLAGDGARMRSSARPRSGAWGLRLGGQYNAAEQVRQRISKPSYGYYTTLTFWWRVEAVYPAGQEYADWMEMRLYDGTGKWLRTPLRVTGSATRGTWRQVTFDISFLNASPSPDLFEVAFLASTNATLPTDFFVDDVSVTYVVP